MAVVDLCLISKKIHDNCFECCSNHLCWENLYHTQNYAICLSYVYKIQFFSALFSSGEKMSKHEKICETCDIKYRMFIKYTFVHRPLHALPIARRRSVPLRAWGAAERPRRRSGSWAHPTTWLLSCCSWKTTVLGGAWVDLRFLRGLGCPEGYRSSHKRHCPIFIQLFCMTHKK